jgi:hypothetical protein
VVLVDRSRSVCLQPLAVWLSFNSNLTGRGRGSGRLKSFLAPVSYPVPFFVQAFIRYMKIRDSRPRVVDPDFDPVAAAARRCLSPIQRWVNLSGAPASPPDFGSLPSPSDVLAGVSRPDFRGLRLRDPDAFISGSLPSFYGVWSEVMHGLSEFEVIRPWLRDGVHIPSFFKHFKGSHNGRVFYSSTPPPMYYQNDSKCNDWVEFISSTILKRVQWFYWGG